MPPRRSARAASAKPASQPPVKPVEKSARRSRSIPARKRAASPDRTSPPPAKKTRTELKKLENVPPIKSRKPSSKAKTALAKKPIQSTTRKQKPRLSPIREAPPALIPQQKPYFNPLPTPPQKQRPPLQLFVWGAGNFGQFGMGPDRLGEIPRMTKNTWVEEQIEKGTFGEVGAGLESITGGGLHSLVIDERGTVWTFGTNDDAALGRVTQDVPDPDKLGEFLDVDQLTSIPHPLESLVKENFRAVQVVSGDSICAAISEGGELRVWGSFRVNEGSLGFSSGLKHQFVPVPILELSHKPGDIEKVSALAAGNNHLVVLTTHGNIYTWGAGEQAQLGRKVLERRKIHGTVPEKVTLGNRSRKAVVVGAGAFHSFAVDEDGNVWGWGLNSMGQTGTGYSTSDDSIVQSPQKIQILSREGLGGDLVVQIAGGEHHTLFRTLQGKVYACGRSNCGQLGLPDDDPAFLDHKDSDFIPEPVQITFPDPTDPIANISCGPHYNMAVTQGGALYCWGQGLQGELGVSDEEVRTPKILVRKEGGKWFAAAVSCGGQHTLGLFRRKE
ncbi:hypothetical protein AMATHDRAFT_47104 [Amanita thiersii Skay4041]|uniref:RCC1-like domain-containing protein n=1 Tax=Amanita thiersii Skay4041 TaxID=703135 RepID=A0A2A9NSW7_9AGAR|nr:hypothetical protein AMATHDRAFT_47104 [Amanita thiersii Skay4041]